ncbi:GNAT family N-acetyltransferase [Actinokineospora terrae]|uniref:GNAT family N-acetyltransferase n=1 Tax=Actinokineospora terrae TaxID=155974 RepID=UPI0011608C2D|nr:GNAT family N-acetyltransferase [Actinokineospora terrae]
MGDGVWQRIRGFEERFARAQASEVVELGWGYAVLQSEFTASWHHNRVIVTGDVDPGAVAATADEVLGGRGLGHRLVQFDRDEQGAAAVRAFACYQVHERIVTMAHSGELPPRTSTGVEALSVAELVPSLIADWRADYPDDTAEQIRELAERITLYERGADVTFLGVRDDEGDVIARGELYIADGVAQFENVIVRPEHREKGLGRQLVLEALHRSAAAGADVWFLIAQAEDWPRGWYERLGYRSGPVVHVYQRMPSR